MAEVEARYRKKRLDRGIKARADTIFAIASYRDILYLILPRALPVILLLVLPLLFKGYWNKVIIYSCMIGLLALSWDFLASCGLFSLGQSLFFGLGAYVAGTLSYYFHWSPIVTIPIAVLGGGLLSAGLLSPVLRLRGVYFAMVTLMMPLLFMKMIETTGLVGGSHGLSSLAPFPNEWVAIYLAVGAFLVCLFVFRRAINEDYGLVLRAIRDDDRAVMSAAINIYWRKTLSTICRGRSGRICRCVYDPLLSVCGHECLCLGLFNFTTRCFGTGRARHFCWPSPGEYDSRASFRSPARLRWAKNSPLLFHSDLKCHRFAGRDFPLYREKIPPI